MLQNTSDPRRHCKKPLIGSSCSPGPRSSFGCRHSPEACILAPVSLKLCSPFQVLPPGPRPAPALPALPAPPAASAVLPAVVPASASPPQSVLPGHPRGEAAEAPGLAGEVQLPLESQCRGLGVAEGAEEEAAEEAVPWVVAAWASRRAVERKHTVSWTGNEGRADMPRSCITERAKNSVA